jgi:hypothetical protein
MSSRRPRVIVTLVAAAFLAACGGSPSTDRTVAQAPAAQPAATAVAVNGNDADTPPNLSDDDIPALPVTSFPAARPMEVVRAVYVFAARHPEVLHHIPCFCGCENRGHRHNDDCFVKARDARGRPTEWEPHGLG